MSITRALAISALVAAAACGDGGKSMPDAPAVDAPAGPACTNAVYDPCTSNAQCTSMNCHLFMSDGFQVCTQACTPGDNTTCPGVGASCNNMGICKPAAANNCTR